MSKLTNSELRIIGFSKSEYRFGIYPIDTIFKDVGGVYIFSNRKLVDNEYRHTLIYCGKSNSFPIRFQDHHKESCIKRHDANCVCILVEDSEDKRDVIEKDILIRNDFKCNDKLNEELF